MPPDEVLSSVSGLSAQEVTSALKKYGYNELPSQKKRNILGSFVEVLKDPMLLMLLVIGLIYVFLGDLTDSLMLLVAIAMIIGITLIQERKTENALAALKDLSSPRALVIRDHRQVRIAGREVTVGDILILREGDRVPADGQVLSSANLQIDESLLTGESLSVGKIASNNSVVSPSPSKDKSPYVFCGTLVTQGHGLIKVTHIGSATQMGQIGKALETIEDEDTLLKHETEIIIRNFFLIGLVLCLVVFAVYVFIRHDWLTGLLSGLTLSMSLLPEEFSVVLVVFLTLGAWRMSKHQVLTRKTASIETLGAATVLCVDKTGTLTENRMNLVSLSTGNSQINLADISTPVKLTPSASNLLKTALLASQQDPFDPLEKEIYRVTSGHLPDLLSQISSWRMVRQYPLSDQLTALSHVWEVSYSSSKIVSAKGSPEAIARLCRFTPKQTTALLAQVGKLADSGMRLIGVASATYKAATLPDSQSEFTFKFVGLLGFNDPVRQTVSSALQECYQAGIRVIMITGDYPGTAKFIAQKIGLKNSDQVITGDELSSFSPVVLSEKIKQVNIFARVIPQQKLLLVDALKRNGEIVAMTGDGVNDAPALKSAHIGIAMGQRGTDVAREASDLVLLDDDFSSIVLAVRMGRRIYDNLKKAMSYIFAIHIPIAGIATLPVILNLPIVLLPSLIAFLELIIDPSCSIVFESEREEADIMSRPPRNLRDPLFNRRRLGSSLIQGASILVLVLVVYFYTYSQGRSTEVIRTVTFSSLILLNLLLIISDISWSRHLFSVFKSRNYSLYIILAAALVCLFALLYIPPLRQLFHLAPITIPELLLSFWVGIFSILWFELLKFFRLQAVD